MVPVLNFEVVGKNDIDSLAAQLHNTFRTIKHIQSKTLNNIYISSVLLYCIVQVKVINSVLS